MELKAHSSENNPDQLTINPKKNTPYELSQIIILAKEKIFQSAKLLNVDWS